MKWKIWARKSKPKKKGKKEKGHDSTQDQADRKQQFYLLNEEQSVFVLTLSRNTLRAVELKANLSAQFVRFRKMLHQQVMRRAIPKWQSDRKEVMENRRFALDNVREFVEVAQVLGHKKAHLYSFLIIL